MDMYRRSWPCLLSLPSESSSRLLKDQQQAYLRNQQLGSLCTSGRAPPHPCCSGPPRAPAAATASVPGCIDFRMSSSHPLAEIELWGSQAGSGSSSRDSIGTVMSLIVSASNSADQVRPLLPSTFGEQGEDAHGSTARDYSRNSQFTHTYTRAAGGGSLCTLESRVRTLAAPTVPQLLLLPLLPLPLLPAPHLPAAAPPYSL